ncbi:hypothetical protein BDB00DRAFT_871426 [Zychaea mexicana]|uniref:uncharacterized protein n=1 Tax=Zychaea mexicana TaxID=64656 RepID=UPI0022FE450A|nr:uncharacterized protein BDB00DRAFT_871426 [Zychaea mexicana]KAI9494336.1 hypothetical protein BDB00DRAFT_871426 [Zychaea mexicana]
MFESHISVSCPQPRNNYPRKTPKTEQSTESTSPRKKEGQGSSNPKDTKGTHAPTKNKLPGTPKVQKSQPNKGTDKAPTKVWLLVKDPDQKKVEAQEKEKQETDWTKTLERSRRLAGKTSASASNVEWPEDRQFEDISGDKSGQESSSEPGDEDMESRHTSDDEEAQTGADDAMEEDNEELDLLVRDASLPINTVIKTCKNKENQALMRHATTRIPLTQLHPLMSLPSRPLQLLPPPQSQTICLIKLNPQSTNYFMRHLRQQSLDLLALQETFILDSVDARQI